MGKIKGIEITDLTIGTGAEVTKDNCVVANVRMFLRRGDEVSYHPLFGSKTIIDLGGRESIAGLRKSIPGMRVGGVRQILISPHLAYGEAGIPGKIPANALLRCVVELLEIRAHNALLPQDFLPGKSLTLHYFNIGGKKYSSWSYVVHENGKASLSIARKPSDAVRDSVQVHQIAVASDSQTAETLIQQALEMPNHVLNGCLPWDPTYIEHKGSSIRDRRSKKNCISIHVMEHGQRVSDYAVPEDNEEFLNSAFYKTVASLINPHLDPPSTSEEAPSPEA